MLNNVSAFTCFGVFCLCNINTCLAPYVHHASAVAAREMTGHLHLGLELLKLSSLPGRVMLQFCDDLLNDLFAVTMARLLRKICHVRNMTCLRV